MERAEGRRQKAEDRGQESEEKGQKAEGRGQESGARSQEPEFEKSPSFRPQNILQEGHSLSEFNTQHSTLNTFNSQLSTPNSQPLLLFSVRDQGRGIPTEKFEAIFERFQQVDASDSRHHDGTGLGLTICRSIVQQHGGEIWVESTLGEGSTFYFTLQIETPAAPDT